MTESRTASGFKPRVWLKHLMLMLLTEERISGYILFDIQGELTPLERMNKEFIL